METYKIPEQTRIGHVHLKVANLDCSIDFYRDLLGFDLTMMFGDQAAFVSAGGYHHHTRHTSHTHLQLLTVFKFIFLCS